jgi:hypothetical protein
MLWVDWSISYLNCGQRGQWGDMRTPDVAEPNLVNTEGGWGALAINCKFLRVRGRRGSLYSRSRFGPDWALTEGHTLRTLRGAQ